MKKFIVFLTLAMFMAVSWQPVQAKPAENTPIEVITAVPLAPIADGTFKWVGGVLYQEMWMFTCYEDDNDQHGFESGFAYTSEGNAGQAYDMYNSYVDGRYTQSDYTSIWVAVWVGPFIYDAPDGATQAPDPEFNLIENPDPEFNLIGTPDSKFNEDVTPGPALTADDRIWSLGFVCYEPEFFTYDSPPTYWLSWDGANAALQEYQNEYQIYRWSITSYVAPPIETTQTPGPEFNPAPDATHGPAVTFYPEPAAPTVQPNVGPGLEFRIYRWKVCMTDSYCHTCPDSYGTSLGASNAADAFAYEHGYDETHVWSVWIVLPFIPRL